jgi:hypothetical protein
MARVFNGSSDLIAANTAFVTNGTGTAFTVAAWVKKSGVINDEIYGEGNTGAAGPFFQFHFDGTTGTHIEVAARSATSGGSDTLTGTLPLADNVWHHVCVTQTTTSNLQLFVDGVVDNFGDRTILSSSGTQVFNTVTIGAIVRNTTASFYTGRIAHLATWRRRVTNSDVATLARGLNPNALSSGVPNYYWPLMGIASPEPDVGSDAAVNGTLTGTTSAVGPPQLDLALFIPSLGRRPVPMIKGPDKDKILSMRGNWF